MRTEKWDGTSERKILIGMIVNQAVVSRISNFWDKNLFSSRWSNLVGSWCVNFFNRYHKPPGKAIVGMFESWTAKNRDDHTIKLVDRFLSSLSQEYESLAEELNGDFIIDTAGVYFNRVRLNRLAESIQDDLTSEDIEKANKRVYDHNRIELGVGSTIDVLQDKEAVRKSFEEKSDSLVYYPGGLGRFFKGTLERDAFISFMGPEKCGKTWWLLDMAWRGMEQRRKVAFFEVGDMSQDQIMRRFMIRAAGRPLESKTIRYPVELEKDYSKGNGGIALVQHKERTFDTQMNWIDAWKSFQKTAKMKIKSNKPYLKLSCHPNTTISVNGITSILQSWEKENWIPDLVIVDYADILAPSPGVKEFREQINLAWKQLRALSQSRHCLVVTATQSDAASYRSRTVNRSNFSDDKRKYAHVTGMIGISADAEEEDAGIRRLNWIVLRESEYRVGRCVHAAGCLDIGNPAIRSVF